MISARPVRLLIAATLGLAALVGVSPVAAGGLPTGERLVGQSAIEPAYDEDGNLIYLLTPTRSPFPTHTSSHAVAPLYLVIYPPGSSVGTLNCMGVPGNCPDHDGIVAGVATSIMPSVYGTNPAAVPGHDHLVSDAASHGDFNIAWEVVEIIFTSTDAANHHLTTLSQINAAVGSHAAIAVDLGFAFHCSIVPAATYERGTPIG
ncbi:MAG TPA: hypothetical protein VFO75_03855 [Candidatus Dormibacteraeota bacterium]|nr:hypothetical protein [Candidatus Dormibacteraeota bacterium]